MRNKQISCEMRLILRGRASVKAKPAEFARRCFGFAHGGDAASDGVTNVDETFDQRAETRERLRRRAGLMLPGGRFAVWLEGEAPVALDGCDLVLAVRLPSAAPLAGFVRVNARPFRQPEPLHAVLAGIHPAVGRWFGAGGVFSHVGGRSCLRRVAGLQEECWVRAGREEQVASVEASRLALALITAGGLGCVPVLGAMLASLAVAVAGLAAGSVLDWELVRWGAAGLAVAAAVASLWVEKASARHFLSKDAREFVLDEVAGMAVTLVFVPQAGAAGVAVAFLAFRFFDVLKPGVKWIEQKAWRGTIVWDDLLAGLYAGVATAAILRFAA